jgi:hypothetical protein
MLAKKTYGKVNVYELQISTLDGSEWLWPLCPYGNVAVTMDGPQDAVENRTFFASARNRTRIHSSCSP